MANIIRIAIGDTVSAGDHVITCLQDGAAADLTGCTLNWRTRLRSAADPVDRSATLVGLGTAGKVTMAYTAAETALLAKGEYIAQVVATDGEVVKTFPGPGQDPIVMIVSEL